MQLLLCFLSQLAFGQSSTGNRPKIGYVFSGGGAKGMAHVGVLKVFEEVGLEPDYITGSLAQSGEIIEITTNPSIHYQTMDCFGASDAWRAQFVSKNWPMEKRDEIALGFDQLI